MNVEDLSKTKNWSSWNIYTTISNICRIHIFFKHTWYIHHNRAYPWIRAKSQKLQRREWCQRNGRLANARLTFTYRNICKTIIMTLYRISRKLFKGLQQPTEFPVKMGNDRKIHDIFTYPCPTFSLGQHNAVWGRQQARS